LTAPRHRDASAGAGRLAADQVATGSTDEPDYRQRHPIVLTKGARTLDVFVTGHASLDGRQRDDLRAFAAVYRRTGQGAILAQMPARARNDAGVHAARINAELTKLGLPLGHFRQRLADPSISCVPASRIGRMRSVAPRSSTPSASVRIRRPWRPKGIKINDGVGN
jgi:type IV pilus biogenesis protein CpaD/CtpE